MFVERRNVWAPWTCLGTVDVFSPCTRFYTVDMFKHGELL